MKKFNKIALLSMAAISTINNQTVANSATVAAAIVAKQTKSIEQLMFECVEKHIPHFADLTMSNVKSKKSHIENLRKDLLKILKNAEKSQINKYANLEKMLESLDINQVLKAVADFKEILKHLPSESSSLIKNNLKDSMTKRILGF